MLRRLGASAAIAAATTWTTSAFHLATLDRTSLEDVQRAAREDMAVIASNEEQLDQHIQTFFALVGELRRELETDPKKPSAWAQNQAQKREKIKNKLAEMKKMSAALDKQWKEHDAANKGGGLLKAVLGGGKQGAMQAMGPALMVPMLEGMYEKFKVPLNISPAIDGRVRKFRVGGSAPRPSNLTGTSAGVS